MTRAWLNRHACAGPDPIPWLLTIVKREAWRSHQRRRELPTDPASASLDRAATDEVECLPARLDLQNAIQGLNADDRAAQLLRYGADMTQPPVAQALNTPEGTIKVRLHRARHELRRTLDHT